eukprot:Skav206693  [mRNA]  locus=scaffold1764:142489:159539:+ [translate_table: standard]
MGAVQCQVHQPEKPNPLLGVLGDVAFPLLVIGFGDQGRAKIMITPETGVKFENVAGIDEAKEELMEIVDFLKAPERFVKVGAKIPRGVLLTGPPGTGKTLMAKALAGESGVPFIQSSASEFIELFVGVGASRVRDIFKQAKEKAAPQRNRRSDVEPLATFEVAPCIVFIDEIDAIGRQRGMGARCGPDGVLSEGAGMGGGNDEREQTLNQILTVTWQALLSECNSGVIVVAATNRSDILDNALLRPGPGRREMSRQPAGGNKKLAENITLTEIAQRTAGFSGADLENLMNESPGSTIQRGVATTGKSSQQMSAILAARRNKKAITMDEINDATDRVIAGAHGGSGVWRDVLWPTTLRRSSSPTTKQARISGALGGRAAEQLVFGTNQVTTGAGGDLQQVERMARAMVTQLGHPGSIAIDDGGFMGPNYSEDLNQKIDNAIKDLRRVRVHPSASEGLTILSDNRACLDRVADELCENETISGDRLRELVAEYTEVPQKLAAAGDLGT